MKRISLFLLIVFASCLLNAQSFILGVKAGVNYSQATVLSAVGADGVDVDDVESQAGMGLVLGGFSRFTAGKLIIEPELLFSENKTLVKLSDVESSDLGDLLSMQVDKVDLPILVGYNMFNKFRLMAGPVFSNIKENSSDPLLDLSNITTGYQLGFGFDLDKLAFDARYEGNLSKFSEFIETDAGVIQVDTRRNLFQFTVGYKLFSK